MSNITLRNFLQGSSIWTEIKTVRNFPFIDLLTVELMDLTQVINHGQKFVFSGFELESLTNIAKILVAQYQDKWGVLYEYELLDKQIDAVSTSVKTSIKSDVETNSETTEGVNKTTAYNSDDLLVDGGNSNTVTGNKTGTGNNSETIASTSIEMAYKNLNLTQKHNIMTVVLKDVSNFLTIDLY